MTGLIIIIAAVLLIGYFAFKRAEARVEFNYVEAEKSIKEALLKLQTEDPSITEPKPEEGTQSPTMSAKSKKKPTKK